MEAFLQALLPRLLPPEVLVSFIVFQGKMDLLANLEKRLRGLSKSLPKDWRVLVIVDRDALDCKELKARMEAAAKNARLGTRSNSRHGDWRVANRIAVEELEAWYFGNWPAVVRTFPKVDGNVPLQKGFRDPDGISGGTWEAFERVLKKAGYYAGGLQKIDAARRIGMQIQPGENQSPSFGCFLLAIREVSQFTAR